MDVFHDMAKVDSQSLTSSDRKRALDLCRKFIHQAEASEALADALNAQQPNFQGFGWLSIERLETLIKALDSSDDDRINTLGNLDPVVIIVCGLSLSTKKIKRMSADSWAEILRQAQVASTRLRRIILHDGKIAKVVMESSRTFKQRYEQLLKDNATALPQISQIMMQGLPYYSYTISHASKFDGLFDLAFNRVVAAYLLDSFQNFMILVRLLSLQ
ncbi:hypothetical protein B0T10DRAFT_487112 [Thelonectria olida]|uniref:Uncharacterized protein n=1 Tax=Thelonectria olida TaxID=1576542 RepID=A0A9P8W3Z3_9HYPO|nr:hypothetical protein B0T10DRAFT_487112 [Thelonectria olida]